MTEQDAHRAVEWYKEHKRHVERLIKEARGKFEPSGSDAIRPELWKAEHWFWFLTK
jgi:hypothetical protein